MRNPIRELKIPQSIADATVFIEKGRKTILQPWAYDNDTM